MPRFQGIKALVARTHLSGCLHPTEHGKVPCAIMHQSDVVYARHGLRKLLWLCLPHTVDLDLPPCVRTARAPAAPPRGSLTCPRSIGAPLQIVARAAWQQCRRSGQWGGDQLCYRHGGGWRKNKGHTAVSRTRGTGERWRRRCICELVRLGRNSSLVETVRHVHD